MIAEGDECLLIQRGDKLHLLAEGVHENGFPSIRRVLPAAVFLCVAMSDSIAHMRSFCGSVRLLALSSRRVPNGASAT